MRLTVFLVFLLLPNYSFSQTQPPAYQQKRPDKDAVMGIDKLLPGKSRHYNWDNGTLKFTIGNNDNDCKKVNVSFNNKPLLQHHCLGKEKDMFFLKLTKKVNFIVLNTDRGNAKDSALSVITLEGQAVSFTLQALCRKKINDTIYIKYK